MRQAEKLLTEYIWKDIFFRYSSRSCRPLLLSLYLEFFTGSDIQQFHQHFGLGSKKTKTKNTNKTNLSQHCGKGSFHNELQRADMFRHTVSHSQCRAFKS